MALRYETWAHPGIHPLVQHRYHAGRMRSALGCRHPGDVAGGEVEEDLGLPDALVDHQRAVAGVEAVELELLAQLGEAVGVVEHLLQRAAGVVLPHQQQHRGGDPVGVGDRGALGEQLGLLVRAAAEQRPVERLQPLGLVPVGADVVGHRDHRERRPPAFRHRADGLQGEVAAPGGTGDHHPLRVGHAARDQVVPSGDHVLDLRPAGVALEGVLPLLAVPGRAAVVDQRDRVAVVDPGLHLRAEAVGVVVGRAAVDQHHRRRGAAAGRDRQEAVHLVARRVGERPALVGDPGRGALPGRAQHGVAAAEDAHLGRERPGRPAVPDRAVGPDASPGDRAGLVVEPLERTAGQTQPVQLVTAHVGVDQQERAAVGPPVGDLHVTGQVYGQVRARPGDRVPDRRAQPAGALVQDGEAAVAGHRREGHGVEGVALAVPQVGHGPEAVDVEGAQRGAQVVAVLGVVDHQQPAVPGEGGQVDGLLVPVQLDAVAAELADADAEAVPVGQAEGDPALGAEREPGAPGRPDAGQQRGRLAAGERLQLPVPDLVAFVVLEPDHPGPVGRDRPRHHPGGMVGDLPVRPGDPVPGVHLPRAGEVGGVHQTVGLVDPPARQGQGGCTETLLPAGLGHAPDGTCRQPWSARPRRSGRRGGRLDLLRSCDRCPRFDPSFRPRVDSRPVAARDPTPRAPQIPRTIAEEVLVSHRARSLAVALTGILAVASLVTRPALADDKRSDLSRTRDRLGQVEAVLRNARADAVAVDAALAEAQRATAEGQLRLGAARTQLAAARQRRVLAEQALRRVSAEVDGLRRQIDARARNVYITGGSADLAVLIDPEHLPDLVDRAVTLDYVAASGASTMARLRGGQRQATWLRARMAAAERDSRAAADAVATEVAGLRQVQAVRERAKTTLDAKLSRLAGQAASLRARSDELRRLIRQEEEARRRAAAARSPIQAPSVGRGAGGRCDLSGTSPAELWIIMHESGGYPTADNPTSTAFGLGQLLLGNRILYLGNDYATIDCGKQLFAFRAYVRDRYGTAQAAQAFWQANGWY